MRMTSTCLPHSYARYSAVVRAMRGVMMRSMVGVVGQVHEQHRLVHGPILLKVLHGARFPISNRLTMALLEAAFLSTLCGAQELTSRQPLQVMLTPLAQYIEIRRSHALH